MLDLGIPFVMHHYSITPAVASKKCAKIGHWKENQTQMKIEIEMEMIFPI